MPSPPSPWPTDAVAARAGWEKSFRASLKHWHAVGRWDYALLDNAHEAEMEAGSFFSLSASAKNYMVGLGVGSSSTQVGRLVDATI